MELVRSSISIDCGLPPVKKSGRLLQSFFWACSAFTHVMACTLAESPSDPLHRRLRQLCCLRCRLDCYRVERTSSRAGVSPAEVQRLLTAHCCNNYSWVGDGMGAVKLHAEYEEYDHQDPSS